MKDQIYINLNKISRKDRKYFFLTETSENDNFDNEYKLKSMSSAFITKIKK
jgi:hypothetical protein